MAISGTSYSTAISSALTTSSSNKFRQDEKNQSLDINLNDDNAPKREPSEFIFRGELLDELNENNGFRSKKDQTIDPANETAINNYEENSTPTEAVFIKQRGNILDAYA